MAENLGLCQFYFYQIYEIGSKIEIVNEIKKLSVYLTFFMFANQNYFRN